jgi:hypothetical protein
VVVFFSTPGVFKWSLSTDPIAWNLTGEFLYKDIVLLCVCVVAAKRSRPASPEFDLTGVGAAMLAYPMYWSCCVSIPEYPSTRLPLYVQVEECPCRAHFQRCAPCRRSPRP